MTHRPLAATLLVAGGVASAPAHADHAPVEQWGEVVIMEGDDGIVTDDGTGSLAITVSENALEPGDLTAITGRFYETYPDDFDEIVVLTTFTDAGASGSLAYEYPVQGDVAGIGSPPGFPASWDASAAWGSTTGRLHAFVDMKGVDDYAKYDGLTIDDPASLFYPVLGQEFAHRWVAYAKFRDASGAIVDGLLGRAHSHWSPLLETQGSLVDGNHWVDEGGGSFACVERDKRYSALDLYLMGLLPARSVPAFFRIDGAVTDNGHPIDPVADWWRCEHVTGRREDLSINQVIDALGPRDPPYERAPKSFRIAFVLITRPGEHAGDVLAAAARIERARRLWEARFVDYTGATGSVCTRVSAPCGRGTARVLGGRIAAATDDGVVVPGAPVTVTFTLGNDGPLATGPIEVVADSPSLTFESASRSIASLAAGAQAEVAFAARFADDPSLCDTLLVAHATATTADGRFKGFVESTVGARDVYRAPFDADAGGWGANLDGGDTALAGAWAWGTPAAYGYYGYFDYQPGGGADGGPCWFTGLARGDLRTGSVRGLGLGSASLWSPPIDLAGASRPHLRYNGWLVALDLSVPNQRVIAAGDRLILEGSSDGVRWYKLDQIDGADDRWRPRDVDLANPANGEIGLDLSGPVSFRFTANRAGASDVVEAGVDDFAVVADAPGCARPRAPSSTGNPPLPAAAGCSIARAPGPPGLAPALLALALLLALRPRRPPRKRKILRQSGYPPL